jgi:E3 ubiquitin-protein ligase UBR1
MEVESIPFKSKRFMPIFSDLRYLMQTTPVQLLLAEPSGVSWVQNKRRLTARSQQHSPNLLLSTHHRAYQLHPSRGANLSTIHVHST